MSMFGWYRPWLSDLLASAASVKAKAIGAVLARRERHGVVTATAQRLGRGGDDGDAYASMDEKTARQALAELESAGWIRRRRSRDHLVITLIPRAGITPDLDQRTGTTPDLGSGTTPAQIGHHTRADRAPHPTTPTGLPELPTKSPGTTCAGVRASAGVAGLDHFTSENGNGKLVDLATQRLADYARTILVDGVYSLSGDWPRPSLGDCVKQLLAHPAAPGMSDDEYAAAVEKAAWGARSHAQSEDRAPHIAGLFGRYLGDSAELRRAS